MAPVNPSPKIRPYSSSGAFYFFTQILAIERIGMSLAALTFDRSVDNSVRPIHPLFRTFELWDGHPIGHRRKSRGA